MAKVREWLGKSEKVGPVEWRRRIDLVFKPSLRRKVASIVWWDVMSLRPAAEAWHTLDDLVMGFREVDEPRNDREKADLVEALVGVGYPIDIAVARLSVLDFEDVGLDS